MGTELIEQRNAPLAQRQAIPGAPTEIADLMRVAVEKGDTATMDKLASLYERFADRQAAQDFNKALAEFQAACPMIQRTSTANVATKSGAKYTYKYAELDEIAKSVGPALQRFGLSYTWNSETTGNAIKVTCILRHINGHSVEATFGCPTDTDAGMSPQQKVAASLTFGRRQSLVQVLGLTMCDPDLDGAPRVMQQNGDKISAENYGDLTELLSELPVEAMPAFLKYMGVQALGDIRACDFSKAVDALNRKIAATK